MGFVGGGWLAILCFCATGAISKLYIRYSNIKPPFSYIYLVHMQVGSCSDPFPRYYVCQNYKSTWVGCRNRLQLGTQQTRFNQTTCVPRSCPAVPHISTVDWDPRGLLPGLENIYCLVISKVSTAWTVLMFDSTWLVCADRVWCLLLPLCFSPLIQIFSSPGILLPPLHPLQSQKYLLALDPNF